jgi:S1-C subfamily serine protease
MNRNEMNGRRQAGTQKGLSGKPSLSIFAAAITTGLAIPALLNLPAGADEQTTSPPPPAAPATLVTPSDAKVAAPSPALNAFVSNAIGPNTIADVTQAAAPSVVKIETDQGTKVMRMPFPFGPDFGQNFGGIPFELFFNGQRVSPEDLNGRLRPNRPRATTPNAPNSPNKPKGSGESGSNKEQDMQMPRFHPQNMGTGFIVRPNGIILTNAHVVKGAAKIMVTLNDGRQFPASLIGTDSLTDVAVIKIEADNLPVAKIGTSKGLRPGEFCIAIGSPMNFDHSVTFGIISAVGRDLARVNENVHLIQTDAAINPGNSGGPLLNLAGDVIGINEAIQANAQNIGFTIPIDEVKDVFEALIAHKRIDRPYIGISMSSIDEQITKGLGLPTGTKGVFIAKVYPGPAKSAGLSAGDIISKIDGKAVTSAKEVQDLVRSHKISDKINLMVLHENQMKAVACNVAQRPDPDAINQAEQEEE